MQFGDGRALLFLLPPPKARNPRATITQESINDADLSINPKRLRRMGTIFTELGKLFKAHARAAERKEDDVLRTNEWEIHIVLPTCFRIRHPVILITDQIIQSIRFSLFSRLSRDHGRSGEGQILDLWISETSLHSSSSTYIRAIPNSSRWIKKVVDYRRHFIDSLFFYQSVLNVLYVKSEILHVELFDIERVHLIKRFNDLNDSLLIFIIMYQVTAQRLNLDTFCFRIIVSTSIINAVSKIQA